MNAFAKAIETGLREAVNAERNNKEIQSAIEELSGAVSEATKGKIKIIVDDRHGIYEVERSTLISNYSQNTLLGPNFNFETRTMLFLVRADKEDKRTSIAQFEMGPKGYPCVFTIDRNRMTCHDKISLIKVLSEIMALPSTGQAILKLQQSE